MNTLIYKRTHRGDPNSEGTFGCHDCMGRVRGFLFDAVIGVGGKRPWPKDADMALKINWIGLNPYRVGISKRGHPVLKFQFFRLWNSKGPDFKDYAKRLYRHMFVDGNRRFVLSESLPTDMQNEVADMLRRLQNYSPGRPLGIEEKNSSKRKCWK